MGRFDYPSPYWDSVGDPALDLIDRMLTVDVEKRYTIDECLEHPWTTQKPISATDSTDGIVGGIAGLDFTKRKVARERTLLSSINDVKVTRVIELDPNQEPVKIYVKNPNSKNKVNKSVAKDTKGVPISKSGAPKKEQDPAGQRKPDEFMGLGGKGDVELFGYDGESRYNKDDDVGASKAGS